MTKPSTEGPVCPNCHRQFTCDEPFYYNESGFSLECDECEIKFAVEPHCSWSWTSRLIEPDAIDDEAETAA